ncbi:hypothetical protein [Candidatus Poriferisodalis sp.]|uniref:hypothetical protein n=1 Tax=Candidatus Poriferisodalis sp. TaxID=3101277 RepID=UPI003B026F69
MSVVGSRRWRLAAAVAAVVVGAALLTPTVASASGSERKDVTLSFAQAPSGWSVVEGQAADVGTLAVNGIAGVNKKHIQWAIKGSAAFSVVGDKDTATVRYDGTTLDADKVRLRITADIGSYRARKLNWNVTRAGVIVRVAVTAADTEPTITQADPEQPEIEPDQQTQKQTTQAKQYNLNPRQPRLYPVRRVNASEYVHWHRCQNPHGTYIKYKGYELKSTPSDGHTYLIKHAGGLNGSHHDIGNAPPCYRFHEDSTNNATGFVTGGDYIEADWAAANGDNPGNLRAKYITRWKGQMDKAAERRKENSGFWQRAGHLNYHWHDLHDHSGNSIRHKHAFTGFASGKDKKCHQHSQNTANSWNSPIVRKPHATGVPDPVPSNYNYGATYEGQGLSSAYFAGEGVPTETDCIE